MEEAWIISCGTELTLGQGVDTNAAWLAERLATLGLHTTRMVTVPDDAAALCEVLREAAAAADVVLVTGGLGPTEDDLTRQALAAAAGVPLELHVPSLERMRALFADRQREMPAGNRVQAMIPRGGRALPNFFGTAPGIVLKLAGTACYALPGVPFEMQAMFDRVVLPELEARARRRVLLSRHLHCFGQGEADIAQQIRDLMDPGRNPAVGTCAKLGLITLRICASADSLPAAESLLDETEHDIRARLGTLVFGRDQETLAAVVGALLVAGGHTLSTAESCTGGLIGELLTDVPGSSRYYVGGVVSYANRAKQGLLNVPPRTLADHGAVSAPVAHAMAVGARSALGADYALAVTGIAGPTGGSAQKPVGLVYIAVGGPATVDTHEFRFGSATPRPVIRLRAAHTALNLLRLELLRTRANS